MVYAICAAAATASVALAVMTLDLKRVRRCRLLRPAEPENAPEGKQLTKQQIRLFSGLIAVGAAVTMWRLAETSDGALNACKLALTLVLLTGSACVDGIEHRIPNIFPGVLALSAVVILTAAYAAGRDGAPAYLISGVFAAALCGGCLTVGSILSHHGIGFGDIKLICALALMGGVYTAGGTLFFSMLLCALVSCGLLMTKKKTMKETVPFGPFILVGYMLTICASVY